MPASSASNYPERAPQSLALKEQGIEDAFIETHLFAQDSVGAEVGGGFFHRRALKE
jgi:hypothetical protein